MASVRINDLGLTSGSETFRFIVQQNSTDPTSTYLATDNFIIHNSDVVPTIGTISPNPASVNENAGRLDAASDAKLQIGDSAITNTGDILVDGTLAIDVSLLTLNGAGTVMLAGGMIEGSASGETLHNAGNT